MEAFLESIHERSSEEKQVFFDHIEELFEKLMASGEPASLEVLSNILETLQRSSAVKSAGYSELEKEANK